MLGSLNITADSQPSRVDLPSKAEQAGIAFYSAILRSGQVNYAALQSSERSSQRHR